MKRIPVLLIASIFIFLLSACGKDTARTIAVEELNGTTHVTNQSGTMDVYVGQHLISGDDVNVETDSNMTLLIDMDKHLFADAGTHFSLEATGSKGNTQTKINLFEGSVLSGIDNKLKDSETYEVSTPNATMAVRGTVFQVICEKISDGSFITKVKVSEGSVEATTIENGETTVKTINIGDEAVFSGQATETKNPADQNVTENTVESNSILDAADDRILQTIDSKYFGVYEGDGITIIVAPGVEAYQICEGGLAHILDPSTDFWIVKLTDYSEPWFSSSLTAESENYCTDFTRNEDGSHYVDMSYSFENDTLNYHRIINTDGYEENKSLKKTSEDPVERYNSLVSQYEVVEEY